MITHHQKALAPEKYSESIKKNVSLAERNPKNMHNKIPGGKQILIAATATSM
jgi:hypothetical protein